MEKELKISIIHPYLENRLHEIGTGLYPSHHFWATEKIENYEKWNARRIITASFPTHSFIEKIANKTFFRGSPGAKVEFSALKAARASDFIYSVCGPLVLANCYPKKLISWVFAMPPQLGNGIKLAHRAYKPKNLSSNAGFLCLTSKAEKYYSQFAPSKFIPWCVDIDMFDGKPPASNIGKPFFLATGKTYRDYETLVKAAKEVSTEIRIIGPSNQKPNVIPSNVKWVDTSKFPPDQAIDYPTLREWYAQSIAVCIPLSGDAEDTCGYTNMLEGMAMRKPILMTKSGCLDLDPERQGFGITIKPDDPKDWVRAMNSIVNNFESSTSMGQKGREIVEKSFTIDRFNKEVIDFIHDVVRT